MTVKAIARYNIITGKITTDDDLRCLDGIFESKPFENDETSSLWDIFDLAYDVIEPILPQAYCDSLELVEVKQ